MDNSFKKDPLVQLDEVYVLHMLTLAAHTEAVLVDLILQVSADATERESQPNFSM